MRSAIGGRRSAVGGGPGAGRGKGRTFGAWISPNGVSLVEYRFEKTGMRVIEQWASPARSLSIREAVGRLRSLISSLDVRRGSIAIVIDGFNAFHHVMVLPPAADDVLRPVIRREVQQVFGIPEAVVAFSRVGPSDRRDSGQAAAGQAGRQLVVAGAPREIIDALRDELNDRRIVVTIATVVTQAIHRLYEATGGSLEPTAVLVCLESGPRLAFFLDGRLELAINPPSTFEAGHPDVSLILDHVARGAVDFGQHFPGAAVSRVLLAARADQYDELAGSIESRLGAHVKPLVAGSTAPEAVVAMGAILEAQRARPLDLFPHPPSIGRRATAVVRGPNGIVAAAVAAAVVATAWSASQFTTLSALRGEAADLRNKVRAEVPAVEPIRRVAERRADRASVIGYLREASTERSSLTRALAASATAVPDGIRFDALHVGRSNAGWNVAIEGQVTGATSSQVVHSLDRFYQSIRSRPGITSPNLDRFEFPASNAEDSTHIARGDVGPLMLQFRVSYTILRFDTSAAESGAGGGPASGARR